MKSATPALLLLVACASEAPAPPSHFEPAGDVKQVMAGILDPAADVLWNAVRTIIDEKGTHEYAPKTTEEWGAVWRAALTVAESGNLLMMEGRARDKDRWMTLSLALVAAGKQAVTAAADHNPQAVFDAGGQVYEACLACHAAYRFETLAPADSARGR
jgi:hypothetical protein